MEFLALAFVAAFLAAALTVPAGFGLSTMLTPVVLLMMGPHEAVAVVAVGPTGPPPLPDRCLPHPPTPADPERVVDGD